MRCFTHLFVVASAVIRASADFNDGYETVNTATDPLQIRLAYQGPGAMMVSWNTFSQLPNPSVSYGTNPGALTQVASSSVSVTYATSLTYNNHVNVTGLLPYTTYYYLPQYSNATTPYSFTTARVAGDMTPFTMGVVVDMGTFGALGLSNITGVGAANPLALNEQTTIAALVSMVDSYEFMVHAGDIAYADYWLKEEIQNYLPTTTTDQGAVVFESILNAFFDELEPISRAKAYMVAPGNHEANCDNGGTTNKTSGQKFTASICLQGQTNFIGYSNHWRMPSGPSNGVGNFWYSYSYGMAHFIHIDTETDLGNGLVGPDEGSPEFSGPFGSYPNQQIDWLTNELASVNRTLTPWIIVFGHRGWYLSSTTCAGCKTAFEQLLYQYNVDVYINGHAHFYERTAPIYNGIIDPNGLNNPRAPLYITNGAAGHYDGLDTFGAIQPYSVFRENSGYAWTTISFVNSSHITINSLWSANKTVFDSVDLYKNHDVVSSTSSAISSTTILSSSSTSSTVSVNTISSDSTSLSTASSNTIPTPTTNTPTVTSTAVYPTYTNFRGLGHLYIVSSGTVQGDIGSAGTWYNAPGQNTATYTAVPLYPNGTSFLIQHGTVYCNIGSDLSFGCLLTSSTGATAFGQTADGNLTYNGSPAFYASSVASTGARPTIYAKPLAVSMNIVWGTDAVVSSTTSATLSSSKSSGSAFAGSTATSSLLSSSSSSLLGSPTSSTTDASVTPTSLTISSSMVSTSAMPNASSSGLLSSITSSSILSSTTTIPSSTIQISSTGNAIGSLSSTTTSTYVSSTSASSAAFGSADSSVSTQLSSACGPVISITVTQAQATYTITSSYPVYTTIVGATTLNTYATSVYTSLSTITQISSYFTTLFSGVPTTIISTSTVTQTILSTYDILGTVTQTTIEPPSTITVTQPASIITSIQPASTISVIITQTVISTDDIFSTIAVPTTEPVSTITITQPVSIITSTQPVSTISLTITQTASLPGQTSYITLPGSASTVTTTQPGLTITSFLPASTVISTQPVSISTLTQPGLTITSTLPASVSVSTLTLSASSCPDHLSTTVSTVQATSLTTLLIISTVTQTAFLTETDTVYQTKTAHAVTHTTVLQTVVQTVTNFQNVKTTVFLTATKVKNVVVVSTSTSTSVKVVTV